MTQDQSASRSGSAVFTDATTEQKAAMFEWLRQVSLAGKPPEWFHAGLAMHELNRLGGAVSEQQPLNPVRALLGKRTPNFEAAEALGLPTPRLQFRWELLKRGKDEIEGSDWLCHYELVIRLGKNDIRNPREYKQESEKAMPLGGTKVNTTVEPLRNGTVQTPFRDSGHMKWDAEQLGIKHCYAIYGDIVTPLGQSNERNS